VPELPEVETARSAIERAGLGRRITEVDDDDTYVCRPHAPGEIRDALIGRTLTGAFRRGKTIWCETSGVRRSRTPGPVLGLHLGMSGHILITAPGAPLTEGGDWMNGRYDRLAATGKDLTRWDRFIITYADGGTLRLFDPRRLGRVRLDPNLDDLGPDAGLVSAAEFAERVSAAGARRGRPPSRTKSRAPIKARLLDQSVIAGVGNLLADEILWQARISPRRLAGDLTHTELTVLHEAVQAAVRSAIDKGGSHTGTMIDFRKAGRHCPRCGSELSRATVGGRTTWWCPHEQV
jgi:formamidopyrimidine-DNA glycosylase